MFGRFTLHQQVDQMMKTTSRIHKKLKSKGEMVDVKLSVILFEEDKVHFLYSPALDLYGYGRTSKVAEDSFDFALEAFVEYTTEHGTFEKELKKMGWVFTSTKRAGTKYRAPHMDQLIVHNRELSNIIRRLEFRKVDRNVPLPVLAR